MNICTPGTEEQSDSDHTACEAYVEDIQGRKILNIVGNLGAIEETIGAEGAPIDRINIAPSGRLAATWAVLFKAADYTVNRFVIQADSGAKLILHEDPRYQRAQLKMFRWTDPANGRVYDAFSPQHGTAAHRRLIVYIETAAAQCFVPIAKPIRGGAHRVQLGEK